MFLSPNPQNARQISWSSICGPAPKIRPPLWWHGREGTTVMPGVWKTRREEQSSLDPDATSLHGGEDLVAIALRDLI